VVDIGVIGLAVRWRTKTRKISRLCNGLRTRRADRLYPERHPTIRVAKDCAAAAVLVASVAALLIGILTLGLGLHLLNKA
jgi:hypothetical protein